MSKNIDLDISNLEKCLETLENCHRDYINIDNEIMRQYIEDACVKRFEYTIETSWKLMKKFLKLVYGKEERELTINNIFRYMEGYGFITSWENWKFYYEKRNDTCLEYNREKAQVILSIIDKFIEDTNFLYENLSKAIGELNASGNN